MRARATTVRWGRQKRPLVVAHRGASKEAVENTLPAFRLARKQGADGVELDVMRCGSGEVVVFHDDDLARLGGGTARDRVRAIPWSRLERTDLGGGANIPQLTEVFEELGAGMLINVELKSPPSWAGRLRDDGLAGQVAELIRRHGAEERVLVSSFDPLLLARFRAALPQVATGLLFGADQSRPFSHAWSSPFLQPTALHPEAVLVDAVTARAWRHRGYLIHVWTVDAPDELRCLAALGVDALITNQPAAARQALVTAGPPA
jgi:glycerophosphoryl diester phosphodiesterase